MDRGTEASRYRRIEISTDRGIEAPAYRALRVAECALPLQSYEILLDWEGARGIFFSEETTNGPYA